MMSYRDHTDFRLTSPASRSGMRVKRRLVWIAVLGHGIATIAFFACFVSPIWWMDRLDERWARPEFILVGYFAAPVLIYIGIAWSVTRIAFLLGWMTWEESVTFPLTGRRWPDSWLEPIDPKLVPKPVSAKLAPSKSKEIEFPRVWSWLQIRGQMFVGIALCMQLLCLLATAAVALAFHFGVPGSSWELLRTGILWMVASSLAVCPTFVLASLSISEATIGQRWVVVLIEAVLFGTHLSALISMLQ